MFHCFPGTVTEKSIVRGDGGTRDPEINADDFPIGDELYIWQCYNHVKPESALAIDQVSAVVAGALFQQTNCMRVLM